jgi:hypothetical protein
VKRPVPWRKARPKRIVLWLGDVCWYSRWWPQAGAAVFAEMPLPADARRKGFYPPLEVFEKMKQPHMESRATAGEVIPIDPSLTLKKFPLFQDLILAAAWDDGVHKGQRSVMLFLEGSIVKVLVKIGKQRLKAMISARSLDDALAGWELCLKNDQVPWEQEEEESQKQTRKRK